jgi:N-ethylmaleimide reductase
MSNLFSSCVVGKLSLANRIVMAPMTRSRALGNVPNELIARYYGERASAGLIVTEGTSPSPNGLGYPRMPGAFSEAQGAGWKLVADAVHKAGGKIFVQLMHAGRVGHPENLPAGAELVAPSALAAPGEMYTDSKGPLPHPTPRALRTDEIAGVVAEFVAAAKNVVAAGIDGVELHGANGYLLEQFLNPATNQRTDEYGGSAANRRRLVVEVARAIAAAIGGDKVGIRLSPYGVNGGMQSSYDGIDDAYVDLVRELADTGIQYVHVVDHSAMGAPPVPSSLKEAMRAAWPRTFILAGGFDKGSAQAALNDGAADLIAFGRPALANPDLVTRLQKDLPLNAVDFSTLYTPGEKGFIDYPKAG